MILALLIIMQTLPTTQPATAPIGERTVVSQSTSAVVPVAEDPRDPFFTFYATNLRGYFFSGFLTLTGFLFSIKTFIVVNMKKELYDHQGYRDNVHRLREVNKNLTVYGPLKRLSWLLVVVVLFSLLTAVSQLTIGLVPAWGAAVFCLGMAIVTVILLIAVLFLIKRNLLSLFGHWEAQANKLMS